MSAVIRALSFCALSLIALAANTGCELEFNSGNLFYEAGNRALEENDLDRALTAYNDALAINPQHTGALYNRSVVWSRKGNLDQALADVNACLELDPADVMALFSRAITWLHKQEYHKAIADCNEVLRLAPDHRKVHNERGAAWAKLGDHEQARRDFEEVVRRNADSPKPHLYANLALTCARLGDLQQAVDYQTKAVELAPAEELEKYRAELQELTAYLLARE